MISLPAGTVTFLFTDIEGSTRLWEQHPEAMRQALARHDALLREIITSHGGQVFKTVGDAFYAVFSAAPDALAAARTSQQQLAAESWSVPGGLRVRMALHTGTAEVRDVDYYGPTLNRVARLLAAGHGGQILLSEATRALVEHDLPPGITLHDQGRHRLKDLARPEQIFQVVAPDLPADFPTLRSLDTLPNNLPRQLTSFIGREHELAEIKDLLTTSALLTLTGPGGSGKTRLALQAGAELIEANEDGVWLVELATLTDPHLIPQAVASSLGVRDQLQRPSLMDTLIEFLRPKSLLTLMDNCEHLRAACADLAAALLRSCPRLRILATSQAVLGVPGEVTYSVPPLSMPDPARLPRVEELLGYEAIRLFVERAVLSQPRFTLTARNAPTVAQICRRLDGIPLAIELAAARVKAIPVEEIAARLDDRFRLLTGGARATPPQHQTLQATLDWSYDLLTPTEQTLLRRLSVFAGGFTLEAVEAICAGDESTRRELLDVLTQLVDRSLVLFEEQEDHARYRLLETIRLYGREKFVAAGDAHVVRGRHRDFYLLLAERAEPHLTEASQADWLNRLEHEHENMRAALEWSRIDPDGAEGGLRLAGALWRFWEIRGFWSEGREWLEAALAKAGDLESPARVKVLNGAAYLAFFQGDHKLARALGEDSLTLSRRLGDKRGAAFCLNILGFEACRLENYKQARVLGEESLVLSRETGDTSGIAGSLAVLGLVARGERDLETARTLLTESLEHLRQIGDQVAAAAVLTNLGLVVLDQGNNEQARVVFEESIAQFQELKDKWGIAFSQSNLGILAWKQHDYRQAETWFRDSLELKKELGDKRGIATSLIGLASVAAAVGQLRKAAILFGAAEVLREAIDVPLPPFIRDGYNQLVADMRAALGEGAFTASWSQGRSMTFEQAVDSVILSPASANGT